MAEMIYCANNNTLYPNAASVCRDLNLDAGLVSNVLAGRRKTAGVYAICRLADTSAASVQAARAWLLYSYYKICLDVSDSPNIYGGEK